MPSQLKSDTARANGAKSHGPKTAEGKENSSKNSLRHGFTSRHSILLDCENPKEFKEMQEYYVAMHRPATLAEQDLVDEMVGFNWRIRRIRTVEVTLVGIEMVHRKPEVEKKFLQPDSIIHMAEAHNTLA